MNYSTLDLHALLDILANETMMYTSIMKTQGDRSILAIHKRNIGMITEELERRQTAAGFSGWQHSDASEKSTSSAI